jgi:hypothetical protein
MEKTKEILRQIQAYNLKVKLQDLAKKNEQKRPFKHLPKQFSKGILIGSIAIVPKKSYDSRYEYVIADMVNAKILYQNISLKQTAILLAHYLAEGRHPPTDILKMDEHFNSKIFELKNFKRLLRMAEKQKDDNLIFVYENKIIETNRLADYLKHCIQDEFDTVFRTNSNK